MPNMPVLQPPTTNLNFQPRIAEFSPRLFGREVRLAKVLLAGVLLGGLTGGLTHIAQTHSYASPPEPTPVAVVAKKVQSPAPAPTPVAAVKPDSATLQAVLDGWQKAQAGGSFGVVVQELNGQNRNASINPNVVMSSASLYKLFLAQAIYTKVDKSQLSLDDTLGMPATIGDCMESMIVWSDNDCGVGLANAYGWINLDHFVRNAGYGQTTASGDNTTSAADVAKLLTNLQNGQLLSANSTASLLDKMKRQAYRYAIPAGVPGVAVADKIGDYDTVWNDAGIVYGHKSTYVLVVLTDGSSPDAIKDLSARVGAFFEQ